MNEKKICFIICSSDPLYAEECLYYISRLHVPAGYQTEAFTVEGASSMAAGYNEGMQASDAKYKVYLHQDTFIVNPNFIQDFLDIFQRDERIGMIGMIGASELPASGIMWEAQRCGAIYVPAYNKEPLFRAGDSDLTEVESIDGLLMITQYDLLWREDIFDKWDFYDCSQSQEFIRHGYKVVVPKLEEPWCLHDSTISYLTNYEEERRKFVREYLSAKEGFGCGDCKFTVVLTSHNRREQLRDTLEWLKGTEGISNIIVVDNGSGDGTADWLSSQQYEYLWFDEGAQGYGKVWNTVLQNFETEEYIVFMEAGVFPERRCLTELRQALEDGNTGVASPISNYYGNENISIKSRETLTQSMLDSRGRTGRQAYRKTLFPNWKAWAVRKDVIDGIGFFREELKYPENVLTDYCLRMMKNGTGQTICRCAGIYEDFGKCREIYENAELWRFEDRAFMKTLWGMNYFNLRPNYSLVGYIEEQEERFKVLEIGCDLGATLFEIQSRFPNCKTYGMDINREAIEIARCITEAEYGNIEELRVPFHEKFDYIIFGDVLEHLRRPEEVIRMCRDLLSENGYIIASIPNIMHISVMEELIEGRFRYCDEGLLDRTHVHFFTYYEIMDFFQSAGYVIEEMDGIYFNISERQKELSDVLLRLSDKTEAWMYNAFQYIVKARRQ